MYSPRVPSSPGKPLIYSHSFLLQKYRRPVRCRFRVAGEEMLTRGQDERVSGDRGVMNKFFVTQLRSVRHVWRPPLSPFPPHREGESGDNASNPYAAPTFTPTRDPCPHRRSKTTTRLRERRQRCLLSPSCRWGSYLFIGFIFALTAIIVGFIGRSKAKRLGQPTGQVHRRIILGFVGIVVNIIAAAVIISPGIFSGSGTFRQALRRRTLRLRRTRTMPRTEHMTVDR